MNELAKNCVRTSQKLSIDKYSAALEQLESAIESFFRARWSTAITLAGAAEYMLPRPKNNDDLFGFATTTLPTIFGMSEPEVVTLINEQRDWLKHVQMEKPISISIDQDDVIIMIMRAYLRFRALTHSETPSMLTFRVWVENNRIAPKLFDSTLAGGLS